VNTGACEYVLWGGVACLGLERYPDTYELRGDWIGGRAAGPRHHPIRGLRAQVAHQSLGTELPEQQNARGGVQAQLSGAREEIIERIQAYAAAGADCDLG
jgi:alkanesulfonate monooxygenase SsuD/methylene tetrahydromethanopterin reductase-like flavin-dependent oxidoreductase (luciferase family)